MTIKTTVDIKSHLVVMTMINTICSHTIRQKSTNVFGNGPEGQKVMVIKRLHVAEE